MKALTSTLLHTLELAVVLAIAYLAQQFFNVSNEVITGAVVLALGASVKYLRASKTSPINDYVNAK